MSHGDRVISASELSISQGSAWTRLPLIAGVAGVLGTAGALALGAGSPKQFAFSWLVAFLYFLSIALGALFFVIVHFLANAGWGVVVRRLAENVMATLPMLALLAIPIMLRVHELFPWSHADHVAHDPVLQAKAGYLNTSFFYIRALIYLGSWSLLSWWYLRVSRAQDVSGDPQLTRRRYTLAGPSMLIFAITLTFASFDWIMSLDPHWYSTIFGVYYFAGCLIGVFALLVLLASALELSGELRNVVTVEHFHDLGKLLYAFTVFWAYIGFSQYFLIWYANLPEETTWFLHRTHGGWGAVTIFLAVGHFIVPFFFLMSRHIKRRRTSLMLGAVWMLLVHLVDLYWLVMPNLHTEGPSVGLLDLLALVGVGGLFFATLFWVMQRQALIPVRDPRLAESLFLQNF